jgi:hypothetical protein
MSPLYSDVSILLSWSSDEKEKLSLQVKFQLCKCTTRLSTVHGQTLPMIATGNGIDVVCYQTA